MESEPDSVSCEVCTMVVMMIKEFVDNNKTEVSKLCFVCDVSSFQRLLSTQMYHLRRMKVSCL